MRRLNGSTPRAAAEAEQQHQHELQQRAGMISEVLNIFRALRTDRSIEEVLKQIAISAIETIGFRPAEAMREITADIDASAFTSNTVTDERDPGEWQSEDALFVRRLVASLLHDRALIQPRFLSRQPFGHHRPDGAGMPPAASWLRRGGRSDWSSRDSHARPCVGR